VPANKGKELPVLVTTTALLVASVEATPYPKNTVTLPELIILYWFPPNVEDKHCTGEGADVAAVKVTVLPVFVKAFVLMLFQYY
jgi:hypothetical protein